MSELDRCSSRGILRRLRVPWRLLPSLVTSFILGLAGTGASAGYVVTQLPTLGGASSIAYGLNNTGQVVGMSTTADESWHPVLWSGGAVIDLSSLGGGFEPRGINDAGQIVGLVGGSRVALLSGGLLAELGWRAEFPRINNLSQVVGGGTLWSNGTTTALATLGGSGSVAYGINDLGQVVGVSLTSGDAERHAAIWSGGTVTDLGTLGGFCSEAWAINNAGAVVGGACTASNALHAVVWSHGTLTDLAASGVISAYSIARDVNEAGQIVGFARPERARAALWSGGAAEDLNDLLAQELVSAGWLLDDAPPGFIGINDKGWIVANALNDLPGPNGPIPLRGAFLFTPDDAAGGTAPEPGTAALTLFALLAVMGATLVGARSTRHKHVATA